MQEESEPRVALGGVFAPRAGCLLTPLIPVRAAGAMVVTTGRIVFEPMLHYKLFARKLSLDLDDVAEAQVSGGNVQFSLTELVAIGKVLTIKLRNGASHVFRSQQADELADAINRLIRQRRG